MKNMKRKIMAGSMAVVLAAGAAGAVYVQHPFMKVEAADEKNIEELTEAATQAMGDSTAATEGVYKDETVYVKADTTGKVTETTVSEWLKKPGDGEFLDTSELKGIKNVKGDETFTAGDNGEVSWKAEGGDIYYQGTTKKELPVNVDISYKLDGKDILAKDLKGKDGKVEIHIDYENRSKEMVDVDGKQVEMYTPFTMITGLMLPADEYKNVTIDSGKIISDADKSIVLGLGFPGLKENLNLQDLDINLPAGVTITADVKHASVGPTITVASSEIMDKFGLNDVNDFNSFKDSIHKLSDASEQLKDGAASAADGAGRLADGSGTLSEGINTLNSKSGELTGGVNELADGVAKYTGSVSGIAEGSASVAAGAAQIKEGMNAAQAGINSAKNGADQVVAGFAGNGTAANPGANNLIQGVNSTIAGALSSLNAEAEKAAPTASVENVEQASNAAAAAVIEQLSGKNITLTEEDKAALQSAVAAAVNENVTAKVNGADSGQNIAAAKGYLEQANQYAAGLNATINALYDGSTKLQAGLSELNEKSSVLVTGADELSAGADKLAAGSLALNQSSSLLTSGTSKLKDGGTQLASGVSQLASGAGSVSDGASALADGTKTLSAGMAEFKTTGIDKLTEVFQGDIEEVTSRIDAMTTLGKEYKSFAGIKDGMNGSTKFVIETDAVE